MIKELLKNLGLIIMMIGVLLLIFTIGKGIHQNAVLGASAVLILAGMITHVLISRFVE